MVTSVAENVGDHDPMTALLEAWQRLFNRLWNVNRGPADG
jgi:hypothetical protein